MTKDGEEGRQNGGRPDHFLVLLEPVDHGIGDFVGRGGEGGRLHSFGHARVDKARTNNHAASTGTNERVAETLGECVHPRFCGSVNKVVSAGTNSSDGRNRQNGSVALRAEFGRSGEAAGDCANKVDACRFGSSYWIGIELGLLSEDAKSEDDHVEIANSFGSGIDHFGVRSGVEGIKDDGVGVDSSRAKAIERGGGRGGGANAENDLLASTGDQSVDDGNCYLGVASEHEY